MRIAALDLGDTWTGVAIADPLGIIARPHHTVHTGDLEPYLETFIDAFQISTIVVGHPETLSGTASAQTKKVEAHIEHLQQQFPRIAWTLWDERLTSKQASSIKRAKNKEQKREQHAIAAALILQSYLERQYFLKNKSRSTI